MTRFLILLISVLGVVGVGCGGTAGAVIKHLVNYQLAFESWQFKTFRWCTNGLPFVSDLEKLIDDKTYIVLLQNNYELRSSGGFMGSYMRVDTTRRGVKHVFFRDIYEVDGQLPGHVEPPYPIQEAFEQGGWKLRDGNWDVDFGKAASDTAWFLEKGGEPAVAGIVAVNLSEVASLLRILGPIKVETYDETVTAENLYQLAQTYAEVHKDKRAFLEEVGTVLLEKIKSANLLSIGQLAFLAFREVERGEMLAWFRDKGWQNEIEFRGWGGRLGRAGESDYLYIVEANLGANKANCCVEREVRQEMAGGRDKVTISWRNNSPYPNPKPPESWGGNYINYVRVAISKDAKVQKIQVRGKELRLAGAEDFKMPNSLRKGRSEDMYVVEPRGDPSVSSGQGLQVIGFWAVVPVGQAVTAQIEYKSGREYEGILVRRQPGVGGFPYKLIYNGKVVVDEIIYRDREFKIRR